MLFNKNDIVVYKGYLGKIKFGCDYNKSYIVTLYNYRGFEEIDRQVNQIDLYKYDNK